MANQSKSNVRNIGEILGKNPNSFTFQDPPLINAPNTTIFQLNGAPRQLSDPSKTLKSVLGVEGIQVTSLNLLNTEKGPNGEQVFEGNNDPRIRFVGTWLINASAAPRVTLNASNTIDYIEITFYGTGLNILHNMNSAARDIRASIDGGAEGSNLNVSGTSGILDGRNYRTNMVTSVASGLTLGTHTIKIRNNSASFSIEFHGFEILNESIQSKILPGEIFANGLKYTNSTLKSSTYNSGFDGNPALNGRGGRVIEYITSQGTLGKVIQQTETSQANLTSASHSNEEIIRKINFREFGQNRSDDFSTLGAPNSNRFFSLDDNSTSLIGSQVVVPTSTNSKGVGFNATGAFINLIFTGTGLDLKMVQDSVAGPATLNVEIDGSLVGTITHTSFPNNDNSYIVKIVSGLPYGTHNVRLTVTGTYSVDLVIEDFIIYGPKKPAIPQNAQQINEYYLMANFVPNTTAGTQRLATGVIRKSPHRNWIYSNGTWSFGGFDANFPHGFNIESTTVNARASITFIGTGFDFRFITDTNRSANNRVRLNGLDFNTTNYPTQAAAATVYGTGVTFNNGTAALDMDNGAFSGLSGFTVTGLPYGKYTLELENLEGGQILDISAIDIIVPIHYPNTKVSSMSVGPAIQISSSENVSGIDLSKAKALLFFDSSISTIKSSLNIAAVLHAGTGDHFIYFNKPFKSVNYFVVTGANSNNTAVIEKKPNYIRIQTLNNSFILSNTDFCAVVFGELEDEE